jgi:glycosyltransferase involved in cell wall biosynthesis
VRKKTLIYVTHSYPYGMGLAWKTHELHVFKEYFESVIVVPYYTNDLSKSVLQIEGISYWNPILTKSVLESSPLEKIYKVFFSKRILGFLKEGIENNVFFSIEKFKIWLISSFKIEKISDSSAFQDLIEKYHHQDCIYYSYWGREVIEALVFEKKIDKVNIFSRFHGYDLYPERQKANYLPYQKKILKRIIAALPCSDDGQNRLMSLFPTTTVNYFTARLGTISKGMSPPHRDDVLNLVSCSSLIPLKRVHLIAKCLKFANFKVNWTHIGDGSERSIIQKIVADYEDNPLISVKLLGSVPADEIPKIYSNESFDLFINVSEYEGVPVSIMEALAAGIPILAPAVGGIPELVSNEVGFLLEKNTNETKIWQIIENFYHLPSLRKEELKKAAFEKYMFMSNASINAHKLADFMLNVI